MEEKLCTGLAEKVDKQLTHPKRRQVLFELLGKDFVQKYFSDKENNPGLLVCILDGTIDKLILLPIQF